MCRYAQSSQHGNISVKERELSVVPSEWDVCMLHKETSLFFGDGSRECVDKTALHYFLIHGSYIHHGYL